jgi:carbonic anhydrase
MKRTAALASLAFALFTFACRSTPTPVVADCPPKWSYERQNEWPGFCQNATGQSPIVLNVTSEEHMDALEVKWTPMPLIIENTGHDIEMHANKSPLVFEKEEYELQQFHMHVPPEHHDGQPHAAELHFLHKKKMDPTKLLVVAIFVDEDGSNRELDQIAKYLPMRQCAKPLHTSERIDVRGFLPREHQHWVTYIGSKTTPNCDPNVRFVVLKTALKASPAQIKAFHDEFPAGNNRDVQTQMPPPAVVRQVP